MPRLADKASRARYRGYVRSELEAAGTYLVLAASERDSERASRLKEMAEAEMRHARFWAEKLGMDTTQLRPALRSMRASAVGIAARLIGVRRVIPWLVRGEMEGVRAYARDPDARELAHEERGHETTLLELAGAQGPAQRARLEQGILAAGGGTIRAGVLGVNDGLVSNLSLVMGVAGGTDDPGVILLAGVAGLMAGAFSMAAGEYVSVRSQRDVYERLIELERAEIAEWPEEEEAELRDIYRSKGLNEQEAAAVAKRLMKDPDTALDAMTREELGLSPSDLGSPWGAAISSFVAFVAGAIVPIAPYFFGNGNMTLGLSAGLSAAALIAVGGTLAALTSRSAAWGALRMLLAGSAAALVTYGIGRLVGVSIGG
jgi:VIT1/CCC1 family predicted Fe2+/Mn2+ transporter